MTLVEYAKLITSRMETESAAERRWKREWREITRAIPFVDDSVHFVTLRAERAARLAYIERFR